MAHKAQPARRPRRRTPPFSLFKRKFCTKMPRAEVGTPKYLANAMKSKGLQRLRWYCQVCQKQCRDENGFKCHTQSESHLRQMLVVGESAGKVISDYSGQFQHDFVQMLSRRFGTKRVHANRVYQDFIQDKHHMHMNATRWVTLTEFCKHLGRSGIVRVDETEKGWFIAWIDNSPNALAKQEASLKKERATMSDEQRERMHIAEQIERAEKEKIEDSGESDAGKLEEGLKRDEGEKVVFSFGMKRLSPTADTLSPPPSLGTPQIATHAVPTPSIPPSGGLKLNPLKPTNPLKRPNVFKMAAAAKRDVASPPTTEQMAGKKRDGPMSATERLIHEDQGRKRRRMERDSERLVA